MLLLILLFGTLTSGADRRQCLLDTLLIIGLVTGALHFGPDMRDFNQPSWPSYRRQVERWQLNPQQEIMLWPALWKMTLKPQL